MSVLTKVFIVLLVVLSLLTSAGLIVFVNQTQNFKTTILADRDAIAAAQGQNNALKIAAAAAAADATAARKDRDDALALAAKAGDPFEKRLADLTTSIAEKNSLLSMAQVNVNSLTNELTASEAARTALTTTLASTRTQNDTLNSRISDESLAIADLTNKLDVANAKVREFTESLAAANAEQLRLKQIIVDNGFKLATPEKEVGLAAGAPPINGIVRSISNENNIPRATISVGTDADVKVGMQFYVLNDAPGGGGFLGMLTIESVDAKSATGRLDGPKVSSIKSGAEVKTHLD